MDKMEQFHVLWRRYVNFYVVSNYELKGLTFHNIMGVLLTLRNNGFIESARKISTRYHLFSFQDSGTGKSELMKAADRLLRALTIPSKYTVYDNESRVTGSVDFDIKAKKPVYKYGVLKYLYAYYWDEGSILFRPRRWMEHIHEDFMCVMDEPGWVSKGMKNGDLEYESNATIMSGTYELPEFDKAFLRKGFLQRMSVSYRTFTEREEANIRKGINLLKLNIDFGRVEKMFEIFKEKTETLSQGRWLIFEREAIEKMGILSEEIYRDFIEGAFSGVTQKILKTYFNRFYLLVDKLAAQRALINEHEKITYEDVVYSLNKNKWHLQSLLRIFEFLKGGIETTAPEQREKAITNIIFGNEGKMEREELKNRLMILYKERKWGLGNRRTSMLIDEMIANKKILSQTGEKGKKILILF